MEISETELKIIQKTVDDILGKKINTEKAFDYLTANLFCFKSENIKQNIFDIDAAITDGANDGGIDFVYYDDENSKVILGQNKYSNNFTLSNMIEELNKMSTTIENFKKFHSGLYNEQLRRELQNALDRLPRRK